MLSRPKSIHKIIDELCKCICVCANCHREIHAGLLNPLDYEFNFDESKLLADDLSDTKDLCPVCGKEKFKINKYCSLSCSSKSKFNVKWDDDKLNRCLKSKMSFVSIGEIFGVSDNAVRKRAIKLGLYKHKF